MNPELVVAVLSAFIAVAGIVLSAVVTWRQTHVRAELERQAATRNREAERRDTMQRFRDPLLWAAFDLQSRLYNIVAQGFLDNYGTSGPARQVAYVRHSTLFVVCQYLSWVEILRRRIQFLDLGDREDNRTLVRLLARVSDAWSGAHHSDSRFRIWRSEQRALGEIMISDDGDKDSCIGYAEFCERLGDPAFAKWTESLTEDIEAATGAHRPHPRLVGLQHALMDLIDFLDPDADRFPDHHRGRLPETLLRRTPAG